MLSIFFSVISRAGHIEKIETDDSRKKEPRKLWRKEMEAADKRLGFRAIYIYTYIDRDNGKENGSDYKGYIRFYGLGLRVKGLELRV